jgi:phage/plasmid-like protein (TIGR03299 family)
MSHAITSSDSLFTVRKPAWHGLGVVLERPPASIAEALEAAGLTWEVEQRLVETVDGTLIPELRANVRADTGEILGVVSPRYRVVQNVEAFRFADHLIGSEMHFETAGSLHAGRRVWVLARLPEWISVGGDAVGRYLLVSTGHDGRHGLQAAVTPVRVVCQNTLSFALAGAARVHTVLHRGKVTGRLHEARRVLQLTVDYYRQFAALGDRLALAPMGERSLERILAELYPNGTTDRSAKRAARARGAIGSLFREGQTVGNAPGTKWAALNAIIEWEDWSRPVRGERFARVLERPTKARRDALEAVLAV